MTRTDQELFDTCLNHLREQGQRATGDGNTCLYRAGRLKCAIGALIPDEDYSPSMEGSSPCSSPYVMEAAGLHDSQIELAGVIQRNMHDTLTDHDFHHELERAAKRVAAQFGLSYSEPSL